LRKARQKGFTLIELSIVLVIIGLIVGGVLVGQDLIRAAAVCAQVTQIEKFNTAANTFYGKYGYLPGDIKDPDASNFGFLARGQYAGEGDGNGVIEGIWQDAASSNAGRYSSGETLMFWVDLSNAHLIEGGFTVATPTWSEFPAQSVSTDFPDAKIGNGNSVSVMSGGLSATDGSNYFSVMVLTQFNGGYTTSSPGMTVQQAYAVDKKMDDGFPQTGRVTAVYMNGPLSAANPSWAAGGGVAGASPGTVGAASSTSCFDNAGNTANPMQYSLAQNGGAGVNCALSFRFQ